MLVHGTFNYCTVWCKDLKLWDKWTVMYTKVGQKVSLQYPHIKDKVLIEETNSTQWRCHWYMILEHSPHDSWGTDHSVW